MHQVTIQNVPGYDGTYELETSWLTNRELHQIKRISGVRAGELAEAAAAGDNDVVVAFAAIAIKRAGHPIPFETLTDLLMDAQTGSILVADEDDEPEDETAPLPQDSEKEPADTRSG